MCTGLVERSHIPVVSAGRYFLGVGQEPVDIVGLLVSSDDKPGVLYRVAETIYRHGGNITYVAGGPKRKAGAELQVEVSGAPDTERLVADVGAVEGVTSVSVIPTLQSVYGKRVIVIGGGAQVGMVA